MTSPVIPAGEYSPARVSGGFVFTAGMTPRANNELIAQGSVGREVSPENGRALAGIATLRAIDAARTVLPQGQRLEAVISLTVYVAVDPSFSDLSYIADGGSKSIVDEFPESPLPARAALGVAALPKRAPVEVQLIASLQPSFRRDE